MVRFGRSRFGSDEGRKIPDTRLWGGAYLNRNITAYIWLVTWCLVSSSIASEQRKTRIDPAHADLRGRLARLQLQVTSWTTDGQRMDETALVDYESLTPDIVQVDATGKVTPQHSGSGRILVRDRKGQVVGEVTVGVHEVSHAIDVSFQREVIPVLTKSGCNQGACHAAQHGQGGLKLSLFGYAPVQDHAALSRDWAQRRISPIQSEDSLILRKATMEVAHGGGKRFNRGDDAYEVIKQWVASGVPGPLESEPNIVKLAVLPHERNYRKDQSQQLRVVAHYDDGSKRDVTRRAKYDTHSEAIATVNERGMITVLRAGQTAVMVRYQGHASVSTIRSPYSDQVDLSSFLPVNFIDEQVKSHWQQMGIHPVGVCSDEVFVRRVFLDAVGSLPAPQRVRQFLKSTDPQKREALVDELLGLTGDPERDLYGEEWSAYWALKWGDLLRINRFPLFTGIGDGGMWTFHNWIRQSLRENKPMDQFVREMITARGSIYNSGPANYFKISKEPEDLAETTAQVFLGVRLQCARCHHHPFENYSQSDYYGMAAFFTGVRTKSSPDFGAIGEDTVVFVEDATPIKHPRSGEVITATPLGGEAVDMDGSSDLRETLANWLTDPENPLLARNIVNRTWAYLMGTGLVEPIDDLRITNPPSSPELMDALVGEFISQRFDLRQLMRTIMTSRVYQLSSNPGPENLSEGRFYSTYTVKRLPAEVLLDALDFACGTHEPFQGLGPLGARAPGVPLGTRAIELPDPNYQSVFLDTLGRPKRVIACECERTSEPNLAQTLQLVNGSLINRKLTDKNGRIAKFLDGDVDNQHAITELYLVTLSRMPSDQEREHCQFIVEDAANRRAGLEDVLWALCNTREFLFNH